MSAPAWASCGKPIPAASPPSAANGMPAPATSSVPTARRPAALAQSGTGPGRPRPPAAKPREQAGGQRLGHPARLFGRVDGGKGAECHPLQQVLGTVQLAGP
jgi:hypothetical protein